MAAGSVWEVGQAPTVRGPWYLKSHRRSGEREPHHGNSDAFGMTAIKKEKSSFTTFRTRCSIILPANFHSRLLSFAQGDTKAGLESGVLFSRSSSYIATRGSRDDM